VVLAEKGRIILQPDTEAWDRTALSKAPMKEASINSEVALISRKIRLPHQDPADRFITATASVFGLTLVTEDRKLHEIEGVQILSTRHVKTR
jgi:PIN domain nuclease of toxin-antitoxin system